MGEYDTDAVRIAVLKTQFAEACRRMEEIRGDVRSEQAATRRMVEEGFARLERRTDELESRLRTVEREQGKADERLATWRLIVPLLSGLAAGLGAWTKQLISSLTR